MGFINNMLIRTKLLLLSSILTTGIVLVALIGFVSIKNISSDCSYVYDKCTVPVGVLANMQNNWGKMRITFYKYRSNLITEAEYQKALDDFFSKNIPEFGEAYSNTIADKAEAKALEDLLQKYASYKTAAGKYFAAMDAKNTQEADRVLKEEWAPVGNSINKQLDELVENKLKSSKSVNDGNSSQSNFAMVMLIVVSIIAIIMSTIVGAILRGSILGSISQIALGFKNLINGGNSSTKLDVKSNDEIGQIGGLFNSYMSKVSSDMQEDAKAIAQLNEIASLASTGIFSLRIKEHGASTQVRQAVQTVNSMLDSIETATAKLTATMIEYASANYEYKPDSDGYAGSIGSMAAGLVAIGNSNSELFAMITISGENLETRAIDMTAESEHLASAANEQAASLEETAAAIEEMTGNIQTTSDKAMMMAQYAEEAKKATLSGAKLADDTASAMVGISEATQRINEAVSIIENIAFQTNILSLNAAVEAATAGEAGKGFAVVAQEVRTLANRSAEAAKEIKLLTEQAKSKSEEGLNISGVMNSGFKTIADKIDQTTRMVEEVAGATKEQMIGITQINEAVTQLDQVTQQNAAIAGSVSGMSQEVQDLATSLLDAAKRTKFEAVKRTMVCDTEMIFDTTKLKLDHIKFKETSYSKVKTSSSGFDVVDHNSCALGKWLASHRSSLGSSPAWSRMEVAHEHVHSKVKEFCHSSVQAEPNSGSLAKLAKEIESDTMAVFGCLDEFKSHICKNQVKSIEQ